mmetsp:Transcript_13236/g.33618  ORF Transcript_13236/g.33618 Transcript_13236/m.33618 type:complete len:211 (+) Transcript_13236:179-811(+)
MLFLASGSLLPTLEAQLQSPPRAPRARRRSPRDRTRRSPSRSRCCGRCSTERAPAAAAAGQRLCAQPAWAQPARGPIAYSAPILLEFPVAVVERADLPRLEPATDAVEVEGVVAHAPRDCALVRGGARLVGLALDAQVHDVVPADGAVVHHDVPRPERDRAPLLHHEALLARVGRASRVVDLHVVLARHAPCCALRSCGERTADFALLVF